MQENWQLGRRKSFAVDTLSLRKEEGDEGQEKKGLEKDMKKQRPRSQSLTVTWPLSNK